MKKIITLLALFLFSGVFSCKKICACDPAQAYLFLVLKNTANEDILNPLTPGYFSRSRISMYTQGTSGQILPVNFDVNPPIHKRVNAYQLRVSNIPAQVLFSPVMYVKIGDYAPMELKIKVSNDLRRIDELLIDGKYVAPDKKSGLLSLFYFNLK